VLIRGQVIAPFVHANLTINFETGFVYLDGQPVRLTMHEYQVLSYLSWNVGQRVAWRELVFNQSPDYDLQTYDRYRLYRTVSRLRRKLEKRGKSKHIYSFVGCPGGYMML
jgi:DNA-binding response OmpR family regulator